MFTSKLSAKQRDAAANAAGIKTTSTVDGKTKRLSNTQLFLSIATSSGREAARDATTLLAMEYDIATMALTMAANRFDCGRANGPRALMYEALKSTVTDALSIPGTRTNPVSKLDSMFIEHARICFWQRPNHLADMLGIDIDEIVMLLASVGVSVPKCQLTKRAQLSIMESMTRLIEKEHDDAVASGE